MSAGPAFFTSKSPSSLLLSVWQLSGSVSLWPTGQQQQHYPVSKAQGCEFLYAYVDMKLGIQRTLKSIWLQYFEQRRLVVVAGLLPSLVTGSLAFSQAMLAWAFSHGCIYHLQEEHLAHPSMKYQAVVLSLFKVYQITLNNFLSNKATNTS